MFRSPLILTLLAQTIGAAIAYGAIVGFTGGVETFEALLAQLGLQGIVAAFVGRKLGQPRWWVTLHLIIPAAIFVALKYPLPAWAYLTGFLGLMLVYWNSSSDRVPLYLSNSTTWQALGDLFEQQHAHSFVDLGCGLGGTLEYLARRFPQGRFYGVESAPIPYLLCYLRFMGRQNVLIRYGSLWDEELQSYDMVYCFLSPAPMPALFDKALAEMRPGTMLVSNSFDVPGKKPNEIWQLTDGRQTKLFQWRFGHLGTDTQGPANEPPTN